MVVDGKAIAEEVLRELQAQRSELGVVRLGVLMAQGDLVASSFVRLKARVAERLGVELVREELGAGADTAAAVEAVKRLADKTQGVIVQLPLPSSIEIDAVLATVPESHDVDAIGEQPLVEAPVARAVEEILRHEKVGVAGKRTAVVGAGRLVGLPAAALLRRLGSQVEVITETQGSLQQLRDADIIVLGAGVPGLVKPEMLRDGSVLIDAGTSELPRDAGSKIVGDADPACASKASLFTPVPGGVGPVAVAMIFKNLFELAKNQKSS